MFKPIFTITNDLLNSIAQIEAAKQIIENAPLVPAWERKFQQEARERTVYFSTKIEGNKLDFAEAKKVLLGEKIKTFRRRDIIEIANYREVISYIDKLRKKKIDRDLIFSIHSRVMKGILPPNELGKYRTCAEALINSDTYEVVFEPVESEFVEGEMENLFEWLDSDLVSEVHPVVKAGVIQYEIARIHPFTDGNGRTARLIATYSLYAEGYDIKRFFSLEEYYDQNLEDYYKALESVEQNHDDMTYWLEFFAKGLSQELQRIKDNVLNLSTDSRRRKNLGQIALNERQIKIIDFIHEKGRIRNKDWQNMFWDVSDDSILRDLKDLMKKGVVKKKGRTKAAAYILK
ncbi:MAG: Fic family protein [Candidatus Dojkabacteria bacterium]|nr:Fic family protein [Candidatus Dojkabacteria bacterium]